MVKRYSENAPMSESDPFAEIYDEWSGHMTEDVAFYVDLAREAEGPIVELAVGNGRVAIPVAQETGRKVIGIDLSPAMLAQARERADAEGSIWSSGRETCATSSWRSRRVSSTRPSERSCTCRPGKTAGASSSWSRPRSGRAGDSRGMCSSSIR